MITLNVNGKEHEINLPPDMPLLWVLRDVLGLARQRAVTSIAAIGATQLAKETRR